MYEYLIPTLVVLLFLTASCGSGENGEPSPIGPSGPVRLLFTGGINTRAYGSEWSKNDRIGVFMLPSGMPLSREALAANRCYVTREGDGYFEPKSIEQTVFFPDGTREVDFIAYYPFVQVVSQDFMLPVRLVDQTNPEVIDLLYSKNARRYTSTRPDISLQFDHKLAKVDFLITAAGEMKPEQLVGLQLVMKGMYTTSTFSLVSGELLAPLNVADVKTLIRTDGTYAQALVMPRERSEGVSLCFRLADGTEWTFPLPAGYPFRQGSCRRFKVSLRERKDPATIEVIISESTIDSWFNGGEWNGDTAPPQEAPDDGDV